MAHLEAGIQFHLPTYRDRTVPDLLKLGKTVHGAGFRQIRVTDNLQSRDGAILEARYGHFLDLGPAGFEQIERPAHRSQGSRSQLPTALQ